MNEPNRILELSFHELYPVIRDVLDEGGTTTITVRGNSMVPFLRDGRDKAVFAPLNGRTIRRGDVVFYERDGGQFVMHRVYAVDERSVMTIVGDAQWQLEEGVRPDQLRAFVPRVVRKGKEISCESGYWHSVMTAWMRLRIEHPRLARILQKIRYYIVNLFTDPRCVIRFIKRKLGK